MIATPSAPVPATTAFAIVSGPSVTDVTDRRDDDRLDLRLR
jgi:hypothetical protein